jgi:2-methylcitrate dehydratase PrpD
MFGKAGEEEFADAVVTRADMVALRAQVVATQDDAIAEDQADMGAVLKDGRRLQVHVKDTIGSMRNPLTDAMLEAKFSALATPVLGSQKTTALLASCWALGAAKNMGDMAAFSS